MKIFTIVTLILLSLCAQTGHAGTIQLPGTGQTVSYYTGDDGYFQKGAAVSGQRFTDNGNGSVTDNLTGLIWLKDTHCFTGTQTWTVALGNVNGLSSGRCGLTDGSKAGDWRLPNVTELESLIDLANYNPALPTGHPFKITPIISGSTSFIPDYYWTSTTDALDPSFAWLVNIYSGIISRDYKTIDYYVWPVRSLPPVQYLLTSTKAGAGSGTVTSDPVGISCTGTCSAKFDEATEVTLIPTESFGSFFESWSGGGCSGNGSCLVTMNGATSVTATFSVRPPVNLDTAYYPLINDAYEKAISGASINIQAVDLTESPVFNKSKDVTLKGGFDGKFASNKGYISALSGVMRISSGTVRVENVVIR